MITRIIVLSITIVELLYGQPIGTIGKPAFEYTTRAILEDVDTSSFLFIDEENVNNHNGWRACDGNWDTAWVEGVDGPGLGEWLELNFRPWWNANGKNNYHLVNVFRISIVNGFGKNKALYFANNRVKRIELEFSDGSKEEVVLQDGILEWQRIELKNKNIWASWVKVTIKEVYKGKKYDDTCIGELMFEDRRTEFDLPKWDDKEAQ